ncbi:MAG: DNA mismatch repair protein MutS [Candidatus Cryptobacteroides sp.]
MRAPKIPEDTPLVKQFFEVKAMNPEAILLYRVGDFYETYSDDAVTASKVLGIVLTKRSNGEKAPLPMAGFPYHALEVYLPKLVKAGYKVAVCDQLEDPKLVGRKLVKRGVTELVTPGVAFSDEMLSQKEHNYICGLSFSRNECGAAFLDVSTGTFQIAQGPNEYISTIIGSFAPKEILVQRGCEAIVRSEFQTKAYVSKLEEWAFVFDSAAERLRRQLGVDSLKGYAVDVYPLGICAAGALLVYLDQTHHSGLRNICSLSRIDRGQFVWMDRFTLRNLEVFKSASGEGGVSLVEVVDRCACPMGARLLRQWLGMPVLDLGELERRYDVVSWFTGNRDALAKVQEHIGDIGDLERIIARAAAGKITPKEMLQLSRGLSRMVPIRSICSEGCPELKSLAERLNGCGELVDAIRHTVAQDCASVIGKGPVIAAGVNAELDDLRAVSSGGKDYLLQMQLRESEASGIPSLKIGYNNVFGYYLEVRNTYKDKVPQNWVRKQTLVNAERYITQELKEYEEKILGAEEKIYALEVRIFGELVSMIQAQIPLIQADARLIARIDTLAGFADLAVTNNYCRPVMTGGTELEIKAGRHPVIETLMGPGEEYVPNDISLGGDSGQIMILTGPNMAGKSALLRQTALIVLLAQAGSFVPAASARIGYFDKIFTRVGASDNISRGESTFMVEMLETSMILHNLSERSLVLLDEIGRGTSTYDGMSIASAIVKYIHEYGKGAKTLFATHYHELNELEKMYPRVHNFHIAVKEVGRQVIFLRKLEKGGSANSFGIHVARLAGMPKEVLEEAENTLAALEASRTGEGGAAVAAPGEFSEGMQLSLFQLDDPTLASLRDRLKHADLDNMTPLQAFDMIREMKKELGL